MAELNNIEDALDPMTDVASALEDQIPSFQEFQDMVFYELGDPTAATEWYNKYGKTVERICTADGSTVTFGTPTQIITVISLVVNVLSDPQTSSRTALNNIAFAAYNPFRDGSQADNTYTRLMKVLTTMYFDFYAKGRK